MNKRTILHVLGYTALVIALAVAITVPLDQKTNTSPDQEPQVGSSVRATATISIEGIYDEKEITITRRETVLDVLKDLDAQHPDIQLQTKEYENMGVLIESIGGMTNGTNDEYWQYRVNGEMPHVSADAYTLSGGDAIEWYFAPSEF